MIIRTRNRCSGVLTWLACCVVLWANVACVWAAEGAVVPAPEPFPKEHALLGLDPEQDRLLMQELLVLGYDGAQMAAEAKAIELLADAGKREAVTQEFYTRYQSLALQALRNLVHKAGNPLEAVKMLWEAERAMAERTPPPPVPSYIYLIYQQMDGLAGLATLNAGLTPCLTWRIRLGCLLALLTNKECAYLGNLNIPEQQRLPGSNRRTPLPDGEELVTVEWSLENGSSILAHGYGINNFEHNNSRPNRAGFKWPLRRTDSAMCFEVRHLGVFSQVLTEAYLGYASATAQWWISLEGMTDSRRATAPGDPCLGTQTVDTRHDLETRQINHTIAQACWFRDLRPLYEQTFARRSFPPVAGDRDTWDAASVEVTSTISTAIVRDGLATASQPQVALRFADMGILVLRDRE